MTGERGLQPRTPSTNVVRHGGPTTFHRPNRTATNPAAHAIFRAVAVVRASDTLRRKRLRLMCPLPALCCRLAQLASHGRER
jgi:hypothetical protein